MYERLCLYRVKKKTCRSSMSCETTLLFLLTLYMSYAHYFVVSNTIWLVKCPCVATGNRAYKWIKQMIKVIFRSNLISPSYVRACTGAQRAPRNSTVRQSGLPQIHTICRGEIWLSRLPAMLSPTRGPNIKTPTRDAPLPFPARPYPFCSVSRRRGTFLDLSFKTEWLPPHLRHGSTMQRNIHVLLWAF
jgi:hypothetical protein